MVRVSTITGLDVGTTKVCAVIGEVTPTGVDIIGIGQHASRGLRKGVVANIESTVEAIRRAVQEAEQMGYKYYFSIEHQTSTISYLSAPNVYLTALARGTSAIRFGVMIYQLPFHNPIRLAQDAAMLDHLSRGRLEFGAGTGVSPHEFMRWNVRRPGLGEAAAALSSVCSSAAIRAA